MYTDMELENSSQIQSTDEVLQLRCGAKQRPLKLVHFDLLNTYVKYFPLY